MSEDTPIDKRPAPRPVPGSPHPGGPRETPLVLVRALQAQWDRFRKAACAHPTPTIWSAKRRQTGAWKPRDNAGADAALARVRALVDQWNDTPDYTPSDYDRGRVDQRHDMTQQLLEVLEATR